MIKFETLNRDVNLRKIKMIVEGIQAPEWLINPPVMRSRIDALVKQTSGPSNAAHPAILPITVLTQQGGRPVLHAT
jgi:hypothetical protein